jgi:hypothetical protein
MKLQRMGHPAFGDDNKNGNGIKATAAVAANF